MAVDTADTDGQHAPAFTGAGAELLSEHCAPRHMHMGAFPACRHVFRVLCHTEGTFELRGMDRAARNAVFGLLHLLALLHKARPGIPVRLYFADRRSRRRSIEAPGS